MGELVPESWRGMDPESRRHRVISQSVQTLNMVDRLVLHIVWILRRLPAARLAAVLYMVSEEKGKKKKKKKKTLKKKKKKKN